MRAWFFRTCTVCSGMVVISITTKLTDFRGPNGEASPYPPTTIIRSSAPSPATLTDKPFRIGPFMVELFTVARLTRDRRMSHIRFGLSPGSRLPTPAKLNEVCLHRPRTPWTGLHAALPALHPLRNMAACGELITAGWSASPPFPVDITLMKVRSRLRDIG